MLSQRTEGRHGAQRADQPRRRKEARQVRNCIPARQNPPLCRYNVDLPRAGLRIKPVSQDHCGVKREALCPAVAVEES